MHPTCLPWFRNCSLRQFCSPSTGYASTRRVASSSYLCASHTLSRLSLLWLLRLLFKISGCFISIRDASKPSFQDEHLGADISVVRPHASRTSSRNGFEDSPGCCFLCAQPDKHEIVEELDIPYRDLRMVDPLVPIPYPAAIFIRDRALIVNLENIRMIICQNQAGISTPPFGQQGAGVERSHVWSSTVDGCSCPAGFKRDAVFEPARGWQVT